MAIELNGTRPSVPQLPDGDTAIPGLDLTWSQVMLLASSATDSAGGAGTAVPGYAGGAGLPEPTLDIAGLTAEVNLYRQKLAQETGKSQEADLDLKQTQQHESMKKAIDSLNKQLQNAQKALDEHKNNLVADWCKAIFGMIGAVFSAIGVTTLSLGAGVVAGAGVLMAAVQCVLDLANCIAQTAGVKATDANGNVIKNPDGTDKMLEISFAASIARDVDKDPRFAGASAEDKAAEVQRRSTGVMVLTLLTVIAGGAAGAEGILGPIGSTFKAAIKAAAKDGPGAMSGAWTKGWATAMKQMSANSDDMSRLEVVGKIGGDTADLGDVAASIAKSTFSIFTAEAQRDAGLAQGSADYFNSIVHYASTLVSSDADSLVDLVKTMDRFLADSQKLTKRADDTQHAIVSNV